MQAIPGPNPTSSDLGGGLASVNVEFLNKIGQNLPFMPAKVETPFGQMIA